MLYHVTSKGTGNQLIFEDDEDRKHLIHLFKEATLKTEAKILAWCLMSNHFHILFYGELEEISKAVKIIKGRFANDFNRRHGRTGHMFQGVFPSFPIQDESYLISAVRYIHNNPVRAGIVDHAKDYRWSSYHEYARRPYLVDTSIALGLLDPNESFEEFSSGNDDMPRRALYSDAKMPDEFALLEAKRILALDDLANIKTMDKALRNDYLKKMYANGFYRAQIARLTGISESTVLRATK